MMGERSRTERSRTEVSNLVRRMQRVVGVSRKITIKRRESKKARIAALLRSGVRNVSELGFRVEETDILLKELVKERIVLRDQDITIRLTDGRSFKGSRTQADRKKIGRWPSRNWRPGMVRMRNANTTETGVFGIASVPFVGSVTLGSVTLGSMTLRPAESAREMEEEREAA